MTSTIRVDMNSLTKVLCPRCSNPLSQDNLVPGHVGRHRCKRCEEWTMVIVVGVPVLPEPVADNLTV